MLWAIADAGNDILIGAYYEVADDETLATLQKVGAASMAFLKTCVLTGMMEDRHYDNLVAATIQFAFWDTIETTRPPDDPMVCTIAE